MLEIILLTFNERKDEGNQETDEEHEKDKHYREPNVEHDGNDEPNVGDVVYHEVHNS
jgi:hypothetical protein